MCNSYISDFDSNIDILYTCYFYLSYVYHIIKHDCFLESVLIVINLNA